MIIMHKQTILSLVAGIFLITSLEAQQPTPVANQPNPKAGYTKQEIIELLNKISEDAPYVAEPLSKLLDKINQSTDPAHFEEHLASAIKMLLAIKVTPEQRAQLNKVQALLEKKLQNYKASSPVFAKDFNAACFVDTQDPRFTVTYKDANGNSKQRTYQADISLVGLNVELALRLNMIFFVGTDFDFAQTNKVIELGTGIQLSPIALLSLFSDFFSPLRPSMRTLADNPDLLRTVRIVGHQNLALSYLATVFYHFLSTGRNIYEVDEIDPLMTALSLLNLTYIPFKNISGGMFIVGAVLRVDNCIMNVVRGGTLTPVVAAT